MFTGVPEINSRDLAQRLKSDAAFFLIDVREPWELNYARLNDRRLIELPLSVLARLLQSALPPALTANPAAEVIVLCHHGVRSADVTAWLLQQGYSNVRSLHGGIDAYAMEIDPLVGKY